jgi:BASS family bile acid:Na+ symporter
MVVSVVAETILLPMGLGIAVAFFIPRASKAGRPTTTIATILLLVVLLPIVVRSWPLFRVLIGNGTLVAIVLLTFLGLSIGHILGGPVPNHRTVLALATSSRHPAVAIIIGTTDFPGNPLIISAVLLSLLVSAIASAPYVLWSHKRARRRQDAPTAATPGGLSAGGFHLRPSRNKKP